jgi:YVTN family beta-propeller protein
MAFALTFFFPREVHAHATLIELTARPSTGNIVYWSTLGTPNLQFTTPQNFASTDGITGTVNFSGTGGLVEQCCVGITGTFDGDFAPGDIVVTSASPLTIHFDTPVQTVGAQIQTNSIGDHFTAEIRAFNGKKLLGSFTENGFSGDVADNSNIFLGVQDATADITSIEFSTISASGAATGVAINQMTIDAPPVPAVAYITNSGDGTVSVIDTTKNTVVKTIKLGKTPFGVAVTPDGSKVYIANQGDGTVSVIDAASNKVIATIDVGTNPFGVAVTPDGKTVYVANQGDGTVGGTVSVINTATNTVSGAAIPVGCPTVDVCAADGNRPTGIAFAVTGPDGPNVYVGNLGYVSVISPVVHALAAVNTTLISVGVAATPDGKTVYVASFGDVIRIDVATSTFVFISVDGSASMLEGIAVTPDGKNVYVANSGDGTVWVIDTATNSVSGPIQVGSEPYGVSVTLDGKTVYVANQADGTVSVIDTATNTVSDSVPVGKGPSAFGNFIQPKAQGVLR